MTAVVERGVAAGARPKRRLPGWARSMLVVAIGIAILSITVTLTGQVQLTSSGTAQAAVRLLLPILLAGLGGLWSERAGVVNIGLEGMMILGTWGAAWAGYQWGPWAALLGGIVFGALGGLLHAVATVTFAVDHIVSGVAITLLGLGVTKYLASLVFLPITGNPRESPRVQGFTEFSIPGLSEGAAALEAQQRVVVSDVAGLLGGLVTNLTAMVVIGFALVPLSYYLLWRTRFGLRLRSCGENPVAAESLGVNVYRYKYIGVVVSGALAGLAGAALVLNPGQLGYLEGQTGGRGYIGLAAMIFGNWAPVGLARRLRAVRLRRRAAAARRRRGGARAALHRHADRRGRRGLLGGQARAGCPRPSRWSPARSCTRSTGRSTRFRASSRRTPRSW